RQRDLDRWDVLAEIELLGIRPVDERRDRRGRRPASLDGTERFLHLLEGLGGADVSDDDEVGLVGPVVRVVERAAGRNARVEDVLLGSGRVERVRMTREERALRRDQKPALRVVLRAQAQLLEDDL